MIKNSQNEDPSNYIISNVEDITWELVVENIMDLGHVIVTSSIIEEPFPFKNEVDKNLREQIEFQMHKFPKVNSDTDISTEKIIHGSGLKTISWIGSLCFNHFPMSQFIIEGNKLLDKIFTELIRYPTVNPTFWELKDFLDKTYPYNLIVRMELTGEDASLVLRNKLDEKKSPLNCDMESDQLLNILHHTTWDTIVGDLSRLGNTIIKTKEIKDDRPILEEIGISDTTIFLIDYLKEKDLMTNSIMEGRNLLNEYRDALSDLLSDANSDKFTKIKKQILDTNILNQMSLFRLDHNKSIELFKGFIQDSSVKVSNL